MTNGLLLPAAAARDVAQRGGLAVITAVLQLDIGHVLQLDIGHVLQRERYTCTLTIKNPHFYSQRGGTYAMLHITESFPLFILYRIAARARRV